MSTLTDQIRGRALELGFDLVGFTPAQPSDYGTFYRDWVETGYAGEMGYLSRPDAVEKRADPRRILPLARSIIVVGLSHYVCDLPDEIRRDPSRGLISRYAWGSDYHDVILPRLRELVDYIQGETGRQVAHKIYVDTGPVLEREVAVRAGLGFFGRNTMMINTAMGSYLFLGEILVDGSTPITSQRGVIGLTTSVELEYDEPDTKGTCGRCTRCLVACPTGAFVKPYVLDARRCISYLTIELKGPIPRDLRSLMGNWIFGCDVCQEVCPWVRRYSRHRRSDLRGFGLRFGHSVAREVARKSCQEFVKETSEVSELVSYDHLSEDLVFQFHLDDVAPKLLPLMNMTDEEFRTRFRGSPIKRAKRRGFLRNVAVALGNWGDPAAVPVLAQALEDHEPLIRGHSAWALGRIGGREAKRILESAGRVEDDKWVRKEISIALD